MLKIIEPEERASVRDWKQKLLKVALEHLVEEKAVVVTGLTCGGVAVFLP